MTRYKLDRFTKGELALIQNIFEDVEWLEDLEDFQIQYVKENLLKAVKMLDEQQSKLVIFVYGLEDGQIKNLHDATFICDVSYGTLKSKLSSAVRALRLLGIVKRIRNVKKEQTEEISPQNRKMSLRDSKILWSKVKVESFAFSEATMKVLKTNKIQNLLELVNIYISSNGNLLNLRSTNEYVSEEIIEILKRYIPEIDDIKEMFNSQLVQ